MRYSAPRDRDSGGSFHCRDVNGLRRNGITGWAMPVSVKMRDGLAPLVGPPMVRPIHVTDRYPNAGARHKKT